MSATITGFLVGSSGLHRSSRLNDCLLIFNRIPPGRFGKDGDIVKAQTNHCVDNQQKSLPFAICHCRRICPRARYPSPIKYRPKTEPCYWGKMFMQHATDSGNIPFNSAVLDILLRVLDVADITVIQICRLKWWLGAELNRRHKDFQSSALPTELPSQVVEGGIFNFFERQLARICCGFFRDTGVPFPTMPALDDPMV